MTNLNDCQILLQNYLYPIILLTSMNTIIKKPKLMFRPYYVYAISPNLRASLPHSGIPSGNSNSLSLIELFCSLVSKLPSRIF